MNLQNATSKELICLNCDFSTKLEAIQFLIDKLDKAGKLKGKEAFFKSVLEREDISATGIDMGLAVPHGKSNAVREAAFAVATVKTPIKDWKSIVEGNQVSVIFLLAIPEDEAGSTHLALLSELMTRVSDPAYLEKIKKAKTSEELYDILGENGQSEQTTEENYQKEYRMRWL